MASGHGGYRRPTHPAPVSGPGALSRRTDGQVQAVPTGLPYGDAKALHAQESTAPMSATPALPSMNPGLASGGSPAGGRPPITPIGAPSMRPNEPVTHGVDIGPGGGQEVLPMQHTSTYQQAGPMTQMLTRLSSSDTSGVLSSLLQFAQAQGA